MSDGNGPHHLKTTPVVLKPDMTTERRDATKSDFYPALDADFGGFRGHALISQYTFESDWGMWEMHPKGDETIVLMSGCVEFVYVVGADTVSVTLNEPGDYVVIPMGAWHTANTSVPTSALFVTPGEGTEHASAPPA